MTYQCENCGNSIDIYDMYTELIKWCKICQINKLKQNFANWTSGNEKIDDFIKETQLKIEEYDNIIFEWLPYDQFNDIKEIAKVEFITLYSAIWLDGPLKYNDNCEKYKRMSNEKVTLKSLNNSQNNINEFLNEVKSYSIIRKSTNEITAYGISQNPNTKDYIMVLKDCYCEKCDIMVEWIPYNQFKDIKEIKSDSVILYSAIWLNGPLKYNEDKWERVPNEKVALEFLHNSNNITNKILNKVKQIYGISRNPDSKVYVIVIQDLYCRNCSNQYTNIREKWCEPCQVNYLKQNFANWTSGNEIIDKFIQEMQLKIESREDIIEWIPYNQFINIKEISDSSIQYTAIWVNGLLRYEKKKQEYERISNVKVALKCLGNLQNITNEYLNKATFHFENRFDNRVNVYGISKNPDTKEYIMVFQNCFCKRDENRCVRWCKSCKMDDLKQNFVNWTSGDEKIDNYIQEMQLKIKSYRDVIVEWIPYNQFSNIKEIIKDDSAATYSAIWRNGSLLHKRKKERIPNKKVILKCLYNSQSMISEFLSEAKSYSNTSVTNGITIYGISQHPNMKDYIIVLQDFICKICGDNFTDSFYKWCKTCQINNLIQNFANWSSGNENIDNYIQEMQSKIDSYNNIIVEWIPYNQLNRIKEIVKYDSSTQYMAIWMNGPLQYEKKKQEYERIYNKEVFLKRLVNSQNMISELLNEAKQNSTSWNSENKIIDNYIQVQSEISNIIVEWIPYNQFSNIKEIIKDDSAATYSAIWMGGPLKYNMYKWEYERIPNREVTLKCMYNSQINVTEFLNEVELHSINKRNNNKIYGISQDPNTKDFIIILQDCCCENCGRIYTDIYVKWCRPCQINNFKNNFLYETTGNEKVDNFIQEMQSKINNYNDMVVEWIPYNQFINIKEIGKGGFATVYSAVWINGPLQYETNKQEYYRKPNMKVALKCLYNSHDITNEFLNEVKAYSISNFNNKEGILMIYGISQNPVTKDYIMVLQYADKGSFDNYKYFFKNYNWSERIIILQYIIKGLKKIHNNQMVHCDFHAGNILTFNSRHHFLNDDVVNLICISDMGLCGEVDNIDKTKIYGVMPYVAPEVLKGKPYTQAADIYSFALNICNGIRPEISENEIPKFYIDLMKKCWDSNPENRPITSEIGKLINLSVHSFRYVNYRDKEIKMIKTQIEKAEEYRKTNFLYIENDQSTIHPQAYYTSRLLNPFTRDLSKDNTLCLDCAIND
ncbi:kinase-like domain-containing protein [Rhizophagus clarus]|uniref:Kinase-like domain-containing protein n=1 Tax=Rhizophagus clarus TaxID=94130 RepID=A0A8H3L400_9GLOM|nr:kinase-like domain-containing protein [Rhizophagus clarus]